MTCWNLYLRSPKGVLAYEAKRGMALGTTIELVWVNQQANDLLVACLEDNEDSLNHHSNQKVIVTVVNINWNDVAESETDKPPKQCGKNLTSHALSRR